MNTQIPAQEKTAVKGRLNGFARAMLRIEAARLREAEAAIANGWTPTPSPVHPPRTPAGDGSPRRVPASYWTARAESADRRLGAAEEELARLEAQGEPDLADNNWRRRQANLNRNLDWHQQINKLNRDIPHLRSLLWTYRAKAAAAAKEDRP